MPLDRRLRPTSPLLQQPPAVTQRELENTMDSNEWWSYQPSMLTGVSADLLNRNLWEKFHALNTEMIITKSGRRMFPSIEIDVKGLQERDNYYVFLEIAPASDRRHKYCGYDNSTKTGNMCGGWSASGSAEPQLPFYRRMYMHPDSPSKGNHWMDNPIKFTKVKLTNSINDTTNVVLTSMHKYIPRIWIIRSEEKLLSYPQLFSYPSAVFSFAETEFIAVTAYQNQNITKLKIDNNPFAKGFRETGQSRFKRKYSLHRTDHQAQFDSGRDEGICVSSSDSESNSTPTPNQIANKRVSVDSDNSTRKSARKCAVENNTHNGARDNARPIAVNPLVPTASNPLLLSLNPLEPIPPNPLVPAPSPLIPIALNPLIPIVPNPVSPVTGELSLHRPWLDRPCTEVTPSTYDNSYYSYHSPNFQYGSPLYSQYLALQNYTRFYDQFRAPYYWRHMPPSWL
ncbi:PREDICTED: T-box transcription factor TBX20-like [Vollenhovia emeryi]|uniref:T-box transcription factor TBX20-like n=1 Tax=Vollenhovia emeryi TaxID=411798 RepID=UPI0005F4C0FD|nr:PREDICTED: T-box transcription factor TBX20-like [Vollenhovia emeryi]